MSLGPRLKRLEQQTGTGTQSSLIRDAVAQLRAVELPEGEDRSAVVRQVTIRALEGLELSERMREWDPELRAALSHLFSQLTDDELRAMAKAAPTDDNGWPER